MKICIWSLRGVRDDNVAIKFSYPTCIYLLDRQTEITAMSVYSAYRQIRSTMVSLTFKNFCYIITIFDGCLSFEHFVGPSGVLRKNNILEFSNVLYISIVSSLKNSVGSISFSRELP